MGHVTKKQKCNDLNRMNTVVINDILKEKAVAANWRWFVLTNDFYVYIWVYMTNSSMII